jgi:O-acetylserine/cysteine efflux transporter
MVTPAPFGWRALLLGLAVMVVWGSNFVVIKLALAHLPPLFFATLRFTFAALPMVFFVARPAAPWRDLASYGVLIGLGQFGLLFIAMNGHITPGLASLVVQTQAFFTIGLAMRLTGERLHPLQWVALAFAVAGIAIIALHNDTATTPLGVMLVLGAALCWALGNTVQRRSAGVNMLGYIVWSSLFAIPPLLALSLIAEGPAAIMNGLRTADATSWAAVAWQSIGNSLFGYAAWGYLLGRYPTSTVAPLSLLVPVAGMGAAAIVLGEPLPAWKLAAAGLVMAGLLINLVAVRLTGMQSAQRAV